MKWSSKPSFLKPAMYKPNTSKIVPMAKAMHAAMYEALAKGDKATLRKTCGAVLADRFAATIDTRPPGRRYGWELVRYNKTAWGYPRVMDNKLTPMQRDPRQGGKNVQTAVRQVVVAIASRQRRVEFDDSKLGGGRAIPGSEREVDVVENVVISQPLDMSTWAPRADWKIISLIGEMTPEKYLQEREVMESFDRYHADTTRKKIGA
jgi:protein MBA1